MLLFILAMVALGLVLVVVTLVYERKEMLKDLEAIENNIKEQNLCKKRQQENSAKSRKFISNFTKT